ncbi:capreomycidine synthase [Spirillospora sp. NPDC046719]
MRLRSAPLEDWLRDRYFNSEIDISSSGVRSYSMGELRRMTGVTQDDLDGLVFDDGYSLGTPAVRAAIARRWGDDPDRVMTTCGSGEALSLVLMALLRPGDEVVVVEPGYHLLVEFAAGLGCTVRTWRLRPDTGWRPALDELAALVTERTRAIIVNFPQNPTGTTVTAAGQRRLLDIAAGVGAYVLWDAAFADLVHDGEPLPDASTLYDRAVGFGTFSKAFGLPGLRFGWCLGPPDLLAACVRIRDYTTLHVSPLVELLALGVLEHAESFIGPRLAEARRGRELLTRWADEHADLVTLVRPRGGVSAFPRLEGLEDTGPFCEELFQRRGVLVIPGSCFGAPRHVRVGFGGEPGALAEGLELLAEHLAAFRREASAAAR